MGLKTVVLNSERMNYDGKLDLSVLSSEVKEYASTEQDQILERVQGMDVVVTKEMPVDGDTIARFPDSVQLICEAGTGYNNIDIEAARARGITVCNIPAYSTERVAHTAIMMILNLSSSMQIQQAMLQGETEAILRNVCRSVMWKSMARSWVLWEPETLDVK